MYVRFSIQQVALALLLSAVPLLAQRADDYGDEGSLRGREGYLFTMRAWPFGRIPQTGRRDALAFATEKMQKLGGGHSLLASQAWRPIGPFDLSGRVTALAIHPTDGHTLWAGGAEGGVWRSNDRGISWKGVMDEENSISVGALAVDPSNPDVIYVGTGEPAFNVDTYGGAGLFKSTDGGITWRSAGLTTVGAFSRIVVDPKDSRIIFAGAIHNNSGFYRSTDAGSSWSRTSVYPIYDITINPSNPEQLWVGGGPQGVMRSLDGGRSFAPSGNGIGIPEAYLGRISVQVAPSNPQRLYAVASENSFSGNHYSRVYKSIDGGTTWSVVLDNDPNFLNYFGYYQGEYNNTLAIRPDDPDVVVVGGVIMLETTDGGESWNEVGNTAHLDHHALAFDPTDPTRLYNGNDGGVYLSDDSGLSFQRRTTGLAITQYYAMAIDQADSILTYGGTQDNGTITTTARSYAANDPGLVNQGDGFFVVVDPVNPSIVYCEQPNGRIYKVDRANGTRSQFTTGINLNDPNDQAAWSAPLVMNPMDHRILYSGRRRLYRTSATSTSWRPISPQLPTPISAVALSPLDTATIYVGSDRGVMMVSSDGGTSWSDVTVGSLLPDRAITDIVASSTDSATAWACFSGFYCSHLFKTTDRGRSWKDVGQGLPDIPTNGIAVDPEAERLIYLATDIGVFATNDGGDHWWTFGEGLPRVAVVDLEIHRSRRVLRAATHGRSMWEVNLGPATLAPVVTVPAGEEKWFGNTPQTLVWNGFGGKVRVEYSLDDGASWRGVAQDITDGRFRWSVVDSATDNARVRVVSMDNPGDVAISRRFTIIPFRPGVVVDFTIKPKILWGLVHDGSMLWAKSEQGDSMFAIDPGTLATVDTLHLALPAGSRIFTGLAYRPSTKTFFVNDVTTARIDSVGSPRTLEFARDGRLLRTWPSPCQYPSGLAWIPDTSAAGGYLLVSDITADQNFYRIDADDGHTLGTIPRKENLFLGPGGLAAARDGKRIWEVIDDFSIDEGPRGSSVVLMSLADQIPRCVADLRLTDDSTTAFGNAPWGRIFAHGVAVDPQGDALWVTHIDGGIFKVAICSDATLSVVPIDHPSSQLQAHLLPISPNPFATSTHIAFRLSQGTAIDLRLYDAAGREVAMLLRGWVDAGEHLVPVDFTERPSGVYRYILSYGNHQQLVGTMVTVK